jgi:hypothetical protein
VWLWKFTYTACKLNQPTMHCHHDQISAEMILTKTERNQISSRRLRVQIPELRELTEQVWRSPVNVLLTWQCEKSLQ